MKQLIATLFFVICGVFCVQNMYADRIPSKGKWGPQDIKSIFPAPPTASIDGKNLTIEFTSPLENLTVQIKDNAGRIVYETCISVTNPEDYIIPLSVDNGEYTLHLMHTYGYLTGSFVIE